MENFNEKYISLYGINHTNEFFNYPTISSSKPKQDNNSCGTDSEIDDLIKHLRNETIKLLLKTFKTGSKWVRFYMATCLISCTSITAYMIIGLVLNYLNYEVLTISQTIGDTPALFPRVTICNYINFQNEHSVEFLRQVNREVNSSVNLFDYNQSFNLTYNELKTLSNKIYNLAMEKINANFSDEQKQKLEHDLTDLLFDCQFGNIVCSIENDFVWTYDKAFGNCYVFNSNQVDDFLFHLIIKTHSIDPLSHRKNIE